MKKFSIESIIAFTLGAVFLIVAMVPIPYRFLVSPKDQVYDGTEFWSDDYSAYVSYITQGQQGKWLAYDTHTAEPNLPGIPIHDEYVLWGKLTSIFGLNPIYSYHLFRMVLGGILILLVWKLITLVFNSSYPRLIAFFLTLLVGGFPSIDPVGKTNFSFLGSQFSLLPHIPWLTELDIFYRFVSLPHYLLGNIFFLLTLIGFVQFQKSGRFSFLSKKFALLVAFGLGAGFTHAVSLITLYATFGLFFFLTTIVQLVTQPKRSLKDTLRKLSFLILFIVLTSPILLYFKSLLTLSPWSNLSAAWEATNQYYVPPKDVLLGIGPVVFLAPLGLLQLFKRKTNFLTRESPVDFSLPLLLVSWPLSFFFLFYFSHPFLAISQVRFFQSYFFIPLAILSAPAIFWVAQKVSHFFKKLPLSLLSSLVTLLVFLPTYPLFQTSFTGRFSFFSDFNYLIYPPKDWAEAMSWIGGHTDHNSVVLCAWQCGHHLPFMAGNYVYLGHLWGTLNLHEKLDLAAKFFGGRMSLPEASQFLWNNHISFVFWGYEENNYGGNPEKYSLLLTPVYSAPGVTVYKVISSK